MEELSVSVKIGDFLTHDWGSPMRGADAKHEAMLSEVSPEARVPGKYPLRPIRAMIAEALVHMDGRFEQLHFQTGRPSIWPRG